jgi:hypothetical protein
MFAPTVFAAESEAKAAGIQKRMNYGKPSRQSAKIVLCS